MIIAREKTALQMKIMFYNIAYGTGMNGSLKRYIYGCWRFFWLPFKVMRRLVELIQKEKVDVVCLAEVDGGSFRNRFRDQAKQMADRLLFPFFHSHTKYSRKWSIWRLTTMVRQQHDAIISRKEGLFKKHQLRSGMQKLVQEYVVEGMSIFTVHLAVLSKSVREKQLRELAEIVKNCPRPHLVCGDFNLNRGLHELKEFIGQTGLRRIIKEPTFPSVSPFLYLDHFFASPDVKIKNAGVVNTHFSDHLPVWVEI